MFEGGNNSTTTYDVRRSGGLDDCSATRVMRLHIEINGITSVHGKNGLAKISLDWINSSVVEHILDLPSFATLVALVGKHVFGVVDDTVWIASTSAGDRRGAVFAFVFSAHVKWVLCNDNRRDAKKNTEVVCANHFEVFVNLILMN